MTTTDLTALVPEVSDPSYDLDHWSTFLMSLNGLQTLSQYISPESCSGMVNLNSH